MVIRLLRNVSMSIVTIFSIVRLALELMIISDNKSIGKRVHAYDITMSLREVRKRTMYTFVIRSIIVKSS